MKNNAAIISLLLLGLVSQASALEWTRKLITMTPERGAGEVRVKYEFKNTGHAAVHILGVTTSCGCTVADADLSVIPAGGTGSIGAIFTVGQRRGLQEKKIFVETDESAGPVTLELKIQLPEGSGKKKD